MNQIPETIKSARIRKGYTQLQLAQIMGYASHRSVQQWESGRRPVPDNKKRELARLLGLTLDDLIP